MNNDLDNLSKELDKMIRASEELNGTHNVPMEEIFTNKFVSENSNFRSIQEFFDKGGFDFSSQEAFEKISDEEINEFTSSHTNYETWSDFLGSAAEDYTLRKLGF